MAVIQSLITVLRGSQTVNISLPRNGSPVTVTVTMEEIADYSASSVLAVIARAPWFVPPVEDSEGEMIPQPQFTSIDIPTVAQVSSGVLVITSTFTPSAFYNHFPGEFDSQYGPYPMAWSVDGYFIGPVFGGEEKPLQALDVFLGGTVMLATPRPNYVDSTVVA